jgi:hypothetical protein
LKLLCDQLWIVKSFSNFAERRRPNKQSKRTEPGQRWRRVRRLTGRNGIGLPHRSIRVHLEIKTTGYKRSCKIKTTINRHGDRRYCQFNCVILEFYDNMSLASYEIKVFEFHKVSLLGITPKIKNILIF